MDGAAAPPALTIIRPGHGYDGQFSYRLGLDPFTRERTAEGMTLDQPAYRQQRLLYPLLGWALSLGRSTPLAWVLILLNVIGLAVLAWLSARLARELGRSVWWGLAAVSLPPLAIALANDLPEITAAACIMAGVLLLQRGHGYAAALPLTLAVLAHEHGLLLPLGLALVYWAAPDQRTRGTWLAWLAPVTAYLMLQMALASNWGETPLTVSLSYLGHPLRGLAAVGRTLLPPASLADGLQLAAIVYLLGFAGVGLLALRSTVAHRGVCLAWLFGVTTMLLGSATVWESEASLWRAAVVPLTLGSCVLLGSSARLAAPTLVAGSVLGGIMIARIAWMAMR